MLQWESTLETEEKTQRWRRRHEVYWDLHTGNPGVADWADTRDYCRQKDMETKTMCVPKRLSDL